MICYGFAMGWVGFCYGFAMVLLWFCYGFDLWCFAIKALSFQVGKRVRLIATLPNITTCTVRTSDNLITN
jgi:hypothetical protein